MATTAPAFDIVRAILVALGLLFAGRSVQAVPAPVTAAETSWSRPDQVEQRQVVPALPAYLAQAPLLAADRLPTDVGNTIPGLGEVIWGTHATDKHGQDALLARAAAVAGGPGGLWRCHDPYTGIEKVYAINQIIERIDGSIRERWALVVFVHLADGRWAERTAFITDHNGIKRVLERDRCDQLYRFSHP